MKLLCRFNIAADLVEEAKDQGGLGLAGILVWMRFMVTRQLVWNKNYNVKPRYIGSFLLASNLLIYVVCSL